jgi:nicotinamide-nucleotide amidase
MAVMLFSENLFELARGILEAAHEAELKIATAESCTGGLIMACLTEIPGASSNVERGFIVYANQAKVEMLGVDADLIAAHGAVSEPVAMAMAEGALLHSGADIAVSCTGIAGPGGGSSEKPVGLVCLAVARKERTTLFNECRFGDIGRTEIRLATVEAALKLLFQAM